jgi:hypothetical protein
VSDVHLFRAELAAARGGGAMFGVPAAVAAALGPGKRPPVRVTVGGHTFRTRIAVYGGEALVGVSKANRAAAGVDVGDSFEVEIASDTEARDVVVPDDLAAALAEDQAAGEAFAALSFTHRREYVQWVEEAKRPETRARRVAGTVERVGSGERGGPR